MKRERMMLTPHQFIETGCDFNGRFWIAYSKGATMFFREVADLRRFLNLPTGCTARASFDSWIASLAEADAAQGTAEVAPNHNTRTVI